MLCFFNADRCRPLAVLPLGVVPLTRSMTWTVAGVFLPDLLSVAVLMISRAQLTVGRVPPPRVAQLLGPGERLPLGVHPGSAVRQEPHRGNSESGLPEETASTAVLPGRGRVPG